MRPKITMSFYKNNAGLNLQTSPIFSSPGEAQEALNVDMNTDGSISTRAGCAKMFTTAITDADQSIQGLAMYDYASNLRQLFNSPTNLYKMTGAAAATVITKSFPAGDDYTGGATDFFSYAALNGILVIANGINYPKKFFIASSVEYHQKCGIVKPASAATFNSNVAGTLPATTNYKIGIAYKNSIASHESQLVVSAVMSSGATGGIRINLPGVSADPQVDQVAIYASTAGNTEELFYQTAVADATATYDFTAEPTGDAAIYDREPPPKLRYLVSANNRIFGVDKDDPNKLCWSAITAKGVEPESWRPQDTRYIAKDDGDTVTGLGYFSPNGLVIFKRHRVYYIDSTDPGLSDLLILPGCERTGTISHGSIQTTPSNFLIWYADAGLHGWGVGVGLVRLDTAKSGYDRLANLYKNVSVQYLNQIHSCLSWDNQDYYCTLKSDDYYVLRFKIPLKSFSLYEYHSGSKTIPVSVLAQYQNVTSKQVILAFGTKDVNEATTDGFVYQFNTGTNDASTAISWKWKSKQLYPQGLDNFLRLKQFGLAYVKYFGTSITAKIKYYSPGESGITLTLTLPLKESLTSSSIATWGVVGGTLWGGGSVWGAPGLGSSPQLENVSYVGMKSLGNRKCASFEIELYGSGLNKPIYITGFDILVQVLKAVSEA